jgi:hypothetical protein
MSLGHGPSYDNVLQSQLLFFVNITSLGRRLRCSPNIVRQIVKCVEGGCGGEGGMCSTFPEKLIILVKVCEGSISVASCN